MAVYRCEARVLGRSRGRSATAASAYRAGERVADARSGDIHDYSRRSGVLWSDILAPDNAPDWMRDREALWNAVEAAERRKDAQLAREFILSLPHELNDRQRAELVREFVREQFVDRGMVADVSVHAPHARGDERNHHAHVMLTMRALTAEGFGAKAREWNRNEQLEQWRSRWADYQNRALERAGRRERVDHRSLEARGEDREPEPKVGPAANEMERRGKRSERGDLRRETRERNRLREDLKREAEVIDLELRRREKARAGNAASGEGAGRSRAREQGRFEEWANRKRAELQSRQLDDKGDQIRRHERQRQLLEARLENAYGASLAEMRARLAAIEQRQRAQPKPGLFARMSGNPERAAQEAEALRASLKDAAGRMNEQRGALAREQAQSRSDLEGPHARQQRRLEERIDRAWQRREETGWQPRAPEKWQRRESPAPERDESAADRRERESRARRDGDRDRERVRRQERDRDRER